MELLNTCVHDINRYLWGVFFLIPLLCGTGIFTRSAFVLFKFVTSVGLRAICSVVLHSLEKGGSIRHEFLSSVGNRGCRTGCNRKCSRNRYCYCFRWTWRTFLVVVGSFFGMATIFAEAVLALTFRTRDASGHIVGGPAYYITLGMGKKYRFLSYFLP